ncbi:MAG: RRXRR domain-containing protein, partial [Synergistaceae bacterium]|nr:RRXRR domain-containing protein [Synergistaceae bacterium]
MLVYVLNKDGKPLMPCKPVKARILLRQKKAKVIRREPFTIQLLYGSSGYKQPIILGVGAGAKHIGLSATTKKKELYSADVELRTDIVDLLSTRRELRRGRRSRKTRYRQARFDNRKKP